MRAFFALRAILAEPVLSVAPHSLQEGCPDHC